MKNCTEISYFNTSLFHLITNTICLVQNIGIIISIIIINKKSVFEVKPNYVIIWHMILHDQHDTWCYNNTVTTNN